MLLRLFLSPAIPPIAAAVALLFDPQTSGGLIAGIAAEQAEGVVQQLVDAGVEATCIGHVVAVAAAPSPLIVID